MYNNFNRLYTINFISHLIIGNKDDRILCDDLFLFKKHARNKVFFYTLIYEFTLIHLSRKDKIILQQRKLNLCDTLFITK